MHKSHPVANLGIYFADVIHDREEFMENDKKIESGQNSYEFKQSHGGQGAFKEGEWGKSSEFLDFKPYTESDSSDKNLKELEDKLNERNIFHFRSRMTNPYTGGQFMRDHYGASSSSWGKPPMDYTGIGPKGFELSDQQIFDEVCHRLYLSPIVDARQVIVDVQNGVVYLKGKVNDRSMKKEAEKCAETVLGVKDIFNELQLLN
jgi:hypothetical protein